MYAPIDRRCPQEQFNRYLTVLKNTISILNIPEEKYNEHDRALVGERDDALSALSFCGAKAVPALRDELRRKNGFFGSSLTALKNIGPEAAAASPEIARFMYDIIERLDKPSNDEHWGDIYYILPHTLTALRAIGKDEKSIVPDLLKLLSIQKDNRKRILIAEALDVLGEHDIASSVVLSLTNEENPGIREEASEALGNMSPSPQNISALIELLNDKESLVTGKAALALGQLGSNATNAIPYIQETLIKNRDQQVKYKAALSLISLGLNVNRADISKILTKDIVLAIMSNVTHSNDLNRREAEETIYTEEVFESLSIAVSVSNEPIPSLASAIPALINIVKDNRNNFETRAAAVNLIGAIGSPLAKSTIPELLTLFHQQTKISGPYNFTSWGDKVSSWDKLQEIRFRISIARTLGKLGETNIALPYLINILKSSNFYTKNPDSERFFSFDSDVAGSAVEALGDIGLPEVPYLLDEMSSLKSLQRRAAIYVLYNMSRKHKLPQNVSRTLKSILENKNNNINDRRIAAYALEESGVNVNWFFSKTGLLSLDYLTCLPDSFAQYYDDYYDLFTGKCRVQAGGDGGPNLFYRIKEILFPTSKR